VIPFFQDQRSKGVLPITDPEMTRFNISLHDGVEMVLWAIERAWGGEILVPKLPSYRITDVATAVAPDCRQAVVGIRAGEKLHEEMITASDSPQTVDLGPYYAILPSGSQFSIDDYCARQGARRVRPGFSYDSGNNPEFLSVPQLRDLIETQVNGVARH
jgi:FlaA1/EpsC-like NDP-sugar epimerase